MAARLASRGHFVYATMRDITKKQPLLAEVDQRGGSVCILPLDVTNPETIKAAVKEIAIERGHIDVLINNAGFGIGGFFEDLTDEDLRQQMETNFFGVLNVTREVLPLMRPRRKGKIINISSLAGISSSPCFSAYNSSKWALEGFSESLYHEMRLFDIDVLLVEPGTYKTKIFFEHARYAKNFFNADSPYFEISQRLRSLVDNYVTRSTKDPEEVAKLVEGLIDRKKPPLRNQPDAQAKMIFFLRRFIPFRVWAWGVRRALIMRRD